MKTGLQRTGYTFMDVGEQGQAPYLVMISSPNDNIPTLGIKADEVEVIGDEVLVFRNNKPPVRFSAKHNPWIAIPTDLVEESTREEMLRQEFAGNERDRAVLREIDPEGFEAGERQRRAMLGLGLEDLRPAPGQYA